MNKICCIFHDAKNEKDINLYKLKTVIRYGYAYVDKNGEHIHNLHTWDDGSRILKKCNECGAYVLVQFSEFHNMSNGEDIDYSDYFAVESPEQAKKLNKMYDGFKLEFEYKAPRLKYRNGKYQGANYLYMIDE